MVELASQYGYVGIIAFLILTGCGLPLPEELAIIAAGIMASQGLLDVWLAFAACMFGAIVGDSMVYFTGYYFGHNLMRLHPRLARLLHASRERKVEQLIARHGLKIFFVARFLVGIRSPIYLAAGTLRVPFRRFLAVDAVCATVVVAVFYSLSYVFADHILAWFQVIRKAEAAATVTVVVLALAVGGFLLWRHVRYRRLENALPQAADPPQTADEVAEPDESKEPV